MKIFPRAQIFLPLITFSPVVLSPIFICLSSFPPQSLSHSLSYTFTHFISTWFDIPSNTESSHNHLDNFHCYGWKRSLALSLSFSYIYYININVSVYIPTATTYSSRFNLEQNSKGISLKINQKVLQRPWQLTSLNSF